MTFRQVIKLGGSLLGSDNLRERLPRRLQQAREKIGVPLEQLVIVGGGKIVDAIRQRDRTHPGDPADVHWHCVELLAKSHQIVHHQFPHWHTVATADQLNDAINRGFSTAEATLVSVDSFYHRGTDCSLPTDWRTTSDAIAAYLATIVNADELVLVKSCRSPPMQRSKS